MVATGQDGASRATAWLAAPGMEPEPLAPVDLSDRTVHVCSGDDSGWDLELAFPDPIELHGLQPAGMHTPTSRDPREVVCRATDVVARLRLSRDTVCVSGLLASTDCVPRPDPRAAAVPRDRRGSAIVATVLAPGSRLTLRCAERGP
jgi:hypothetical protein